MFCTVSSVFLSASLLSFFFFVCFAAEWFAVVLGPHDNLCPKLLLLYFGPAFF